MIYSLALFFIVLFALVFLVGYLKLSFIERWAKKIDIWAKEKKQEYELRGNKNNYAWHHIRHPFVVVSLYLSKVTKKYISSIYWRSTIFVNLIAFAFISIIFLTLTAIYAVIYIAMMIFSLWIMYKVLQIITFFLGDGNETTNREKEREQNREGQDDDDVPPIMGPGAKKSRVYKGAMGTVYAEDNKGNKFYKENGMSGEYWEDNKGNRVHKNKGILGGEYWEDNKSNKIHKCEGLLGGEYYEDNKGNIMHKDEGVLEQDFSKKHNKN